MRLAIAAILIATPVATFAQDTERFTLERRDSGWVRLDNDSGEISTCEERGNQLVCRLAADDRRALEDEIEALRERIRDLDQRLTALESARPSADLPSDDELDRTLGFMEKFFRGFMDIVRDLERDFGKSEPDPEPDRT
ncbi:MAG: hypothetical protein K5872_06760 [Rhizobiaceae bacterium]|nr:hypothetical protein [Rhizobiaceae bacterium]MCV0405913.1 hypothetical protein [Rhizobiaceae bacterium]